MKNLERLVSLLEKDDIEVDSIELAESLWLSKYISKTESISPSNKNDNFTIEPKEEKQLNPIKEIPKSPSISTVQKLKKQKRRDVPLHPISDSKNRSSLPFRTPLIRRLYKDNDLIFAFRHFRQKIVSLKQGRLDEEKIADYMAKTDIFIPFYQKSYAKRFRVIFIVDSSDSMKIWESLIDEFIKDVKNYYIFKEVIVYYLFSDNQKSKLYQKKSLDSTVNDKWYRNIDPNSIVFMFSDMISKAWSSGELLQQIDKWQKHFPFAIVQMLPQRLWNGTKLLDASMGKMSGRKKFALNSQLKSRAEEILSQEEKQLPPLVKLPILNFNEVSIDDYGKVMRSLPNSQIEGALFEIEDFKGEYQPTQIQNTLNAEQRLRTFYKYASTQAKILLELLAVVPLSLPIIKLVQQKLLPQSTQEHLSEIFMSSIIDKEQKVDGFYQFSKLENEKSGVREELIKKIGAKRAFETITKLSEVIKRHGGVFDFLAFVVNPDSLKEGCEFSEIDREFARISVSVLHEMGGKYCDWADRLTHYWEENHTNNKIEEDISDLFNDVSVLPLGYILNNRYKIINALGKGGFGIVYKVENIVTKEIFAIKELFINSLSFRKRDGYKVFFRAKSFPIMKEFKERFFKIINIFQDVNNDNLVKIYSVFEENNTIYSKMEYINGKSVDKLSLFSEKETKELLKQLINGLKVIHSKSIIHRDINPTNILKTKEGIYKIIDFTSFKYFVDEEITITGIGTNKFIAPELASTRAKIGIFSDIYSLGITLYSVLNKSQDKITFLSPLPRITQIINDIPNYTERLFENEDRLHQGIDNLNISSSFKNILKKMVELKSENRFQSLEEIEKKIFYDMQIIEYDGLMYQNTFIPKYTWEDAKVYAKNLKLDGYDNWRLPTRKEFKKISNIKRLFSRVKNKYFWTSEEKSRLKFCAWTISFDYPFEIWENKLNKNLVLCVKKIESQTTSMK